jgi:hypothetical protein
MRTSVESAFFLDMPPRPVTDGSIAKVFFEIDV